MQDTGLSLVYPPIMDGLTFLSHMTRDFGMTPQFSAAGTTALSTETVDADGTYQDEYSDLIVGATANTARVGKYGVLSEVQSQNLALQSEDFATTWTATRCSVTANNTTAPDGNDTADKIVEDSTAGATHVALQSVTYDGSSDYTVSVYAKAGERTWIAIGLPPARFPGSPLCYFNLSAGTVGTESSCTGAISSVGSSWYRCSIKATSDAAGAGNTSIYLASADAGFSYDGDGSSGAYLWGAQVEAQSAPTSYIPTTTAAVTRSKDVLTYAGTNNLSLTQGTAFIAFTPDSLATTNPTILTIYVDATHLYQMYLKSSDSYKPSWFVYNAATQADLTATSGATAGTTVVIAVVWAANDFRLYVNGGDEQADTSGSIISGTPVIGVGVYNDGTANQPMGGGKHLAIYNDAKSAADIARIIYWIQTLNGDL